MEQNNFCNSKTKENLMKAFAGESQARNRYTIAKKQFENAKEFAIADLMKFTANQEKIHAEIFYNHLSSEGGTTIEINGGYPVDISDKLPELLKMAAHNEGQESDDVYPAFAKTAREEGFGEIARDFENIAKIESSHKKRFERFHTLMENGELYKSQQATKWVCLNCGYIFEGTQVPENCPVCKGEQGYFIRLEMADWGVEK